MNPEIKAQWVAALRSGDYLQGVGSLRYEGGFDGSMRYCCLGVLCDLAVKAGVGAWIGGYDEWVGGGVEYGHDGYVSLPGSRVTDWAGLALPAASELANINDVERQGFEYIASYIEKYF